GPSQIPSFPTTRLVIVWPNSRGVIDGAIPVTNGPGDAFLYVALHGPTPDGTNLPFANTVRLARVPATAAALEGCVPYNAAGCGLQYWDAGTSSWTPNIAAADSLFTASLGMNGGVTLAYNGALAKWTATYATGPLLSIRMRSATQMSGSWSTEESLLSYCPYFFLPGFGYCYPGFSHPEYDTNGGNTFYITMSTNNTPNSGIVEYSVFLHEITVGKPVVQSSSGSTRRYSIGAPPSGFTADATAFYTVCGDADGDYLSDCTEMNSGNDPNTANYNVDGDVLLDDNGNPVINGYGLPVPLGNAQSVAEDNGVRRQDIDNCPLVNNPH